MKVLRDIVGFLISKWWIFIPSAMAIVWAGFRVYHNLTNKNLQQAAVDTASTQGIFNLPDPTMHQQIVDLLNTPNQ